MLFDKGLRVLIYIKKVLFIPRIKGNSFCVFSFASPFFQRVNIIQLSSICNRILNIQAFLVFCYTKFSNRHVSVNSPKQKFVLINVDASSWVSARRYIPSLNYYPSYRTSRNGTRYADLLSNVSIMTTEPVTLWTAPLATDCCHTLEICSVIYGPAYQRVAFPNVHIIRENLRLSITTRIFSLF
jgi:hypothetical protein